MTWEDSKDDGVVHSALAAAAAVVTCSGKEEKQVVEERSKGSLPRFARRRRVLPLED